MIEITIREYLENMLDVPVLLERPKATGGPYVLMELLDEGITNRISAITFDFTSQADSQYAAKLLSDRVRAALDDIISLDVISGVRFGGAGYSIKNREYRHTITYNFFYYREE